MGPLVLRFEGKWRLFDGTKRLVELPADNEADNEAAYQAMHETLVACWSYRDLEDWVKGHGQLAKKMGEPWVNRLRATYEDRKKAATNLIDKQLRSGK